MSCQKCASIRHPHLFCLPSIQSTPNVDEFEEGIKELLIKIITSDSKNMRKKPFKEPMFIRFSSNIIVVKCHI